MPVRDEQYIHEIGPHLDLFKQISTDRYNFRCCICGDSAKHKYKKRAWFYQTKDGSWNFHCFNCSTSLPFRVFLKNQFPSVYSRYIYDFLSTKKNCRRKESASNEDNHSKAIKNLLIPVSKSEKVLKWLDKRRIPEERRDELFIIKDLSELKQIDKYKNSNLPKEPRLAIPCYDKLGSISYLITRSFRPDGIRYMNLSFNDEANLFGIYDQFGQYKINLNQKIYILEGALDSLFIKNSIAVNNADLLRAIHHFGNLSGGMEFIFIPDADRRNVEILKIYESIINSGHKVVIMPQQIKGKDINEIILRQPGINIEELIDTNTYSGLEALLKFKNWKRI